MSGCSQRPVIEFLTFEVEPDEQDGFLEAEGRIWTTALEVAPGFIRKERWRSVETPNLIHAVIWWESLDLWKSFPDEDVARLDAEMGEWLRVPICRTFDVV